MNGSKFNHYPKPGTCEFFKKWAEGLRPPFITPENPTLEEVLQAINFCAVPEEQSEDFIRHYDPKRHYLELLVKSGIITYDNMEKKDTANHLLRYFLITHVYLFLQCIRKKEL